MKTVIELLELVDSTLSELKASDRLYVVGLLQDAWTEGFEDASRQALDIIESNDALVEDEMYAKQVERAKDILGEQNVTD